MLHFKYSLFDNSWRDIRHSVHIGSWRFSAPHFGYASHDVCQSRRERDYSGLTFQNAYTSDNRLHCCSAHGTNPASAGFAAGYD